MERIRILHITNETGWRGGENQLYQLLKQQRQLGHSAALAAPSGSIIAEKCLQTGAKVFSLQQRSDIDMFAAWELSHIIQTHECDLIHAHTGRSHAIAALANRFNQIKKPIIVSRRVSFNLKNSFLNRLKYKSANQFIPISNASKVPLLSLGIKENVITIIPDGIDTERFENENINDIRKEFGISKDAFVIGNVAHCEPNKNQKMILSAAPKILEANTNAHFVIVGSGPELEQLKHQANKLGIQKQVTFAGFRNDIENFYPAFDCYVITSLEEGLCSSILEAQYCGVPVVATKAGGIPEIIGDSETGILVDINNEDALVQGIMQIMNEQEFAKNIGQAGRESVLQNHSIQTVAEKTLTVYRKLIRV